MRDGKADFSMRDLATEAGVSFATPFNQFGSKAAIMHALSERRINVMATRFAEVLQPSEATARVLLAVDIAVAVMLEEPAVNRAVMGWIGTAGPTPGDALSRSTALWTLALGTGEGIAESCRKQALDRLPRQLALAFRGALSFWTAGELSDEALGSHAREIVGILLRGFAEGHDVIPEALTTDRCEEGQGAPPPALSIDASHQRNLQGAEQPKVPSAPADGKAAERTPPDLACQ